MDFYFKKDPKTLQVTVKSYKNEQTDLVAALDGMSKELNLKNLLWMTLIHPFNTLKVIFYIHLHAFILYFKKVPYFRKNDYQTLQQEQQLWRRSTPWNLLKNTIRNQFMKK
jgi:DUF1365 family protein